MAEEVAKLKAQDGPEIHVHGSEDLIQTLLQHNLGDEYRLWFFPVLLGGQARGICVGDPASWAHLGPVL